MFLRISASGDVEVVHPTRELHEEIIDSLRTDKLTARALSPDITLIIGPRRRYGQNRIAEQLLDRAGIAATVGGAAVLLCCQGPEILERVTDQAFDALDAVGAITPDLPGLSARH